MSSITGASVASQFPGDGPSGRPNLDGDNASTGRLGDRLFAGASRGAGLLVIALVTMIGVFLLAQAIPALLKDQANFLRLPTNQP